MAGSKGATHPREGPPLVLGNGVFPEEARTSQAEGCQVQWKCSRLRKQLAHGSLGNQVYDPIWKL